LLPIDEKRLNLFLNIFKISYIVFKTLNPVYYQITLISIKKRLAVASDKAYLLLAHGRWLSPGTPASSTTKTGRHDIAAILLQVAFKTINHFYLIHDMIYCLKRHLQQYCCYIMATSFSGGRSRSTRR
jgi:hypothetical protein